MQAFVRFLCLGFKVPGTGAVLQGFIATDSNNLLHSQSGAALRCFAGNTV